MLKVIASRDGVADSDNAPVMTFQFPEDTSLDVIFSEIKKSKFFASLYNGKATWVASSIDLLAVLAQQWTDAKLLPRGKYLDLNYKKLDFKDGELRIHFSYLEQANPELIFEAIYDIKTRAP